MEIIYKDEQIKFNERFNRWHWDNAFDVDLGNIKKLIDMALTDKYKGVKAFMIYNSLRDIWVFDPVSVESPAGNRQIKCKDDTTGNVTHYSADALRAATDENKRLIDEINKIQEHIKSLKISHDELVEKLELLKLR